MTKSTKTMFDDYGDSSSEIRKLCNALISLDTYALMRKAYEEIMESGGNSDPFPLWQSLAIYFKDGNLNPAPQEFMIQELIQIGWLQVTSIGNENLYFFLEDGTQGYCKIY